MHIAELAWGLHIIEALAFVTTGALLMYWKMSRRLDSAVAATQSCGDTALTGQRHRHESAFNQLTMDYNSLMDDQRRAVVVCKRMADDIAQLTTENDALRLRLARTPAAVNAWRPKTERGQA